MIHVRLGFYLMTICYASLGTKEMLTEKLWNKAKLYRKRSHVKTKQGRSWLQGAVLPPRRAVLPPVERYYRSVRYYRILTSALLPLGVQWAFLARK